MIERSRRQFLSIAGVASLAGCVTDDITGGRSEENATSLEAVPAAIGSVAVHQVMRWAPPLPAFQNKDVDHRTPRIPVSGLAPEVIDEAVITHYGWREDGRPEGRLWQFSGSFDAAEPTPEDYLAVHRESGGFVASTRAADDDEVPWNDAIDAVTGTGGDAERLLDDDTISQLFARIEGGQLTTIATGTPYRLWPLGPEISEPIENVEAIGVSVTPINDTNFDATHAVVATSPEAVDPSSIVDRMRSVYRGEVDPEIEQDDALVVANSRQEVPFGSEGDDPPFASFGVEYDDPSGIATIEYIGGDSISSAELAVLVNSEQRNVDWGTDSVGDGASVELSVDPFSEVRIEWREYEGNDSTLLHRSTAVDPDTFSIDVDPWENTATVHYDGQRATPTGELLLVQYSTESENETDLKEPLANLRSVLEPGESIVIEDVVPGDAVGLFEDVHHADQNRIRRIVGSEMPQPNTFRLDQSDPALVYTGEESVAATEYQVLANGQPVDRQFDDEFETLTNGDRLSIDVLLGQELTVERQTSNGPQTVLQTVLFPERSFALGRAGTTYRIEYVGDAPFPAENVLIELVFSETPRERLSSQFSDGYETVEPGDAIEFDDYGYGTVDLQWTDPETTLFSVDPGSTEFDFELQYEDETTRLIARTEGGWLPEQFEVRREGTSIGTPFTTAYDVVYPGDAVDIDAQLGEEVVVRSADEEWSNPSFRAPVVPDTSFDITVDDGSVDVEYRNGPAVDASRIDITIIPPRGSPTEVDAWHDQDVITPGDVETVTVDFMPLTVTVRFDSEYQIAKHTP